MQPILEILPPPQRALWPLLREAPSHFVLYGGTAIALRLAHRQSIDFDFFSNEPVSASALAASLSFLSGAALLQDEPNTATFSTSGEVPVKVSFFGGLGFGRTGELGICEDNGLRIASLLDLAAQKMRVICERSEWRDYVDVSALLDAGVSLPQALGATRSLFPAFNPKYAVMALSYFEDGSVKQLAPAIQETLRRAAMTVESVPPIELVSPRLDV
jgi:hypothetical protein